MLVSSSSFLIEKKRYNICCENAHNQHTRLNKMCLSFLQRRWVLEILIVSGLDSMTEHKVLAVYFKWCFEF